MQLINYAFETNNLLRLNYRNGDYIYVDLDANSGRILTRIKRGTISNVQHTGIYLGRNSHHDEHIVLHNHIDKGRAYISTLAEYADGENHYWQKSKCRNDKYTVMRKGLDMIIQGKPYDLISNNCQIYTNKACHNSAHSEDVNNWAGGLLFGMAIFGIGVAIFSSE